ncbi:hypothetical protein DV515_00015277 [Chloebia gouldiae]|uniref:Uncharacterized protein n=1 Tax=Chloebia gouldiae TaxID=44316 RepID=A0A3L8RVZ3_CHLGU|nr:hypothetical protein DV515_00015277 [Chloebia gouldiae]
MALSTIHLGLSGTEAVPRTLISAFSWSSCSLGLEVDSDSPISNTSLGDFEDLRIFVAKSHDFNVVPICQHTQAARAI